jgi:hypothetical protein
MHDWGASPFSMPVCGSVIISGSALFERLWSQDGEWVSDQDDIQKEN